MFRTFLLGLAAFAALDFILALTRPAPEPEPALLLANTYSQEDYHWLTLNIYFEARNQSLAGMLAVGQVVLNRLAHPKYPKTIKEIVTQANLDKQGRPIRNRCQFSWFCDGKPDRPDPADKSYATSALAARLLLENQLPDLIDGATHYHTHRVKVSWPYPVTGIIGDHIFYKREG